MARWKQVIADYHRWAHPPEDGWDLMTQAAATQQQLSEMENLLGVTLPKELRDLYRTYNGFGLRSRSAPDEGSWFLLPVERVPDFVDEIRSWFRETHPDLAAHFVPVIDWANGDGMGYLYGADGSVQQGLYIFSHEEYERDEEQDPKEFLQPINTGIEGFLTFCPP